MRNNHVCCFVEIHPSSAIKLTILESIYSHFGIHFDSASWLTGRFDFLERYASILEIMETIPGFQGSRTSAPPVKKADLTPNRNVSIEKAKHLPFNKTLIP